MSGSWRGDFRIDEAYKMSETPFLRLWIHDITSIAAPWQDARTEARTVV